MSTIIKEMNRPCQLPSILVDLANVSGARIIPTTYYGYEVWMRFEATGCEYKMVDGLTEGQAKYVRDAFNAALKNGGTFNLANCLRRYDAGL